MFTFLTVPAVITNDAFGDASQFRVELKVFSGAKTSFQSIVSTQDLFQIPSGIDYDGTGFTNGNGLFRR